MATANDYLTASLLFDPAPYKDALVPNSVFDVTLPADFQIENGR